MTDNYRRSASSFVDIGRELNLIENAMRSVTATSVVSNDRARMILGEAVSASRRLTRALEAVRFVADATQ